MKEKPKTFIRLTDTLTIYEVDNGWWLWDNVVKMNLAMKQPTAQDAYAKALTYYQQRMVRVTTEYDSLQQKVDSFVDEVRPEDDDYAW